MTTEEQTGDFNLIEELTAYLDGELDEQSVQRVENRLSRDPSYLAEMQSLQKTWDILDELPQTEAGSSFTQTTMEMVVAEAARGKRHSFSWLWPMRIVMTLAAFGVLFGAGFYMLRAAQNESNEFLVAHLATIEFQEQYLAVALDIEFAEAIRERGYFSRGQLGRLEQDQIETPDQEPQGEAGQGSNVVLDPYTQMLFDGDPQTKIQLIGGLDVQQKSRLKRRYESFEQLTDEKRAALIAFGKKLDEHPDRDELLDVMDGYFEWLKTIDPTKRSRLLDEPPEKRVDSIASIRADQARQRFAATNDLSRKDADYVFFWFQDLINASEDKIREHFPKAVARVREDRNQVALPEVLINRLSKREQLNRLVNYLIEIDQSFVEQQMIDKQQIELLRGLLSTDANAALYDRTDDEQVALIMKWVKGVNESNFFVSREKLLSFYESLEQEERDKLDQLPLEMHLSRLRELYLKKNPRNRVFDWRKILERNDPFRR